jgi:hypothetical protein
MTPQGRLYGRLILRLPLYGHRTSPVRVLSVVASSLALHTSDMTSNGNRIPLPAPTLERGLQQVLETLDE